MWKGCIAEKEQVKRMPGRRGNSEGSIVKRSDGRWMARFTLDSGQRKTFYAKTRQEAARQLAEALRDRDKGLPIIEERQTLEQYLTRWFEIVQPTVGPTSFKKYRQQLLLHVAPTLGGVSLSKVSAQQLQLLYAAKLKQGLSGTTVNLLHKIIHRALDDALRLGLVQRNVADMVDPPRRTPFEMNPLTLDQARALLAAAAGTRHEALCALALSTGMRRGELLALTWRHVDLDQRILQVRATLKRYDGRFFIAETKTRRSRRRIALTPSVCDALRRHRAQLKEERLALGQAWNDYDLVFPNAIGYPLDERSMVRYWFRPLLKKAGLPLIRFHDLRHTAATLLLLAGVHPKVVSEMLGHASIAITLDLYSHVLPDMQREATMAMERVLHLGAG
jgi:integrase